MVLCPCRCEALNRTHHPFCGTSAPNEKLESNHDKHKLKGVLQSNRPVLFNYIKVMTDKDRQKNPSTLKEIRESGQLNTTHYPGLNSCLGETNLENLRGAGQHVCNHLSND